MGRWACWCFLQWLKPSLDAFFGTASTIGDDRIPDGLGSGLASDVGLEPSRGVEMEMEMMPVIARDEDTAGKDGA